MGLVTRAPTIPRLSLYCAKGISFLTSNEMATAIDARKVGHLCALGIGWFWFCLAGLGGLGLLIHEGPWPLTNGWFALFSGLSARPAVGWSMRRYFGFNIPMGMQFAVAFLIFLAGRIAVALILHRPFLPHA